MKKKHYKNLSIWITVFCLMVITLQVFLSSESSYDQLPFSTFLHEVDNGKIKAVEIRGPFVTGKYTDSKRFATYDPKYPALVDLLMSKNVEINAGPVEDNSAWIHMLLSWLPLLFLGAVWFFMLRQAQGGGNKAMSFARSKAKLSPKGGKVTFADVAGIDEAKNELVELVDFLKDPEKFKRLGGKIPRGALLVGAPGTGKTLLARAIAGEAGVPFFSISGSEFVEMFVGVGASRVRDMFEQGKKNAPCIIFIDEIDAVGRHRGFGLGGGNDEREQTLNQLLVEMDGFEENDGVIIISATNRPDVLDPALLRPGRFDRQVVVPLPDINGRDQILRVHLKNVPISEEVETRTIARGTPGFSGADLANLVNEAALLAARRGKVSVGMKELEEAKDKVMMGAERKSLSMSEEEKKRTAYHEAGHAIVSVYCEGSDPIHKATIIPRGRSLGMVMRLPTEDKVSQTKEELEANLVVAAGGRIAEEMIFGPDKITTGASSDIEQATKIARRMIIEWGMSEKLGFLSYAALESERSVYLGHSLSNNESLSDEVKRLIDQEIKGLIDKTYAKAEKILKKNVKQLHILADTLIELETLTGEEITDILNGKKLPKKIISEEDTTLVKKKRASKKTRMPSSGEKSEDKSETV